MMSIRGFDPLNHSGESRFERPQVRKITVSGVVLDRSYLGALGPFQTALAFSNLLRNYF
jgi:hypothetical protein